MPDMKPGPRPKFVKVTPPKQKNKSSSEAKSNEKKKSNDNNKLDALDHYFSQLILEFPKVISRN